MKFISSVFFLIAFLTTFQTMSEPGNTPTIQLWRAIVVEDVAAVKKALRQGAYVDSKLTDISTVPKNSRATIKMLAGTPLAYAFYIENKKIIKVLLNNGANHCVRIGVVSTLFKAAELGDEELFDTLIKKGCSPYFLRRYKNSKVTYNLLYAAIKGGNLSIFNKLRAKGLKLPVARVDGSDVLGWSITKREGSKEMFLYLQILLKNGADLKDKKLELYLATAIWRNSSKLVKYLLDTKKNIGQSDLVLYISIALRTDFTQMLDFLISRVPLISRKPVIHMAIKSFLDFYAKELEQKNKRGYSVFPTKKLVSLKVFHWLVNNGYKDVIKPKMFLVNKTYIKSVKLSSLILIAKILFDSEDPPADWLGRILNLALQENRKEIVQWVLTFNGVNPNISVGSQYDRSTRIAVRSMDSNLVAKLLKYGARPKIDYDIYPTVMKLVCKPELAKSLIKLAVAAQMFSHKNKGRQTSLTPLVCAVKNNNLVLVKALLEYKANANQWFYIGNRFRNNARSFSVLTYAINKNYNEMVKLLLTHGAKIKLYFDAQEHDAVMLAVRANNVEALDYVLTKSRNYNVKTKFTVSDVSYSLMEYAVQLNSQKMIKVLIKHGAKKIVQIADINEKNDVSRVLNSKKKHPKTRLDYACNALSARQLEFSLKSGVSPNSLCKGLPLIAYAVALDDDAYVRVLIKYGVNLNKPFLLKEVHRTPLMLAIYKKKTSLVRLLFKAGANVNYRFTKENVKYGISSNSKSSRGNNALIEAVINNNTEMVLLLLESGADINLKSGTGFTPLMMAVKAENLQMTNLLLAYSASSKLKNNYSETAFMLAADNGNIVLMKVLASSASKPDMIAVLFNAAAKGSLEVTKQLLDWSSFKAITLERALVSVVESGNFRVRNRTSSGFKSNEDKRLKLVRLLLAKGVLADTPGLKLSPMHILFRKNFVERRNENVLKVLLKAGANPNRANKDLNTPVILSVMVGDKKIVALLLKYKANVCLKNKKGQTAIDHASNAKMKLMLQKGSKQRCK